ncbi:MAG: hypothetical protein JXB88_11940 [Spirochaetales bacterium]|nr:hypothetical protein [Spirochaetales bacterium]
MEYVKDSYLINGKFEKKYYYDETQCFVFIQLKLICHELSQNDSSTLVSDIFEYLGNTFKIDNPLILMQKVVPVYDESLKFLLYLKTNKIENISELINNPKNNLLADFTNKLVDKNNSYIYLHNNFIILNKEYPKYIKSESVHQTFSQGMTFTSRYNSSRKNDISEKTMLPVGKALNSSSFYYGTSRGNAIYFYPMQMNSRYNPYNCKFEYLK